MKIGSPLLHKKARIEIIPLIDIMFFLLASFMLASLSMIRLQSVKMDLPTATTASKKLQPGILNISVDRAGVISIDKVSVTPGEITSVLSNKFRMNTNVPVYISADTETEHGTVNGVLDLVRRAGIQKVSFAIAPRASKQ
jgi:biopolymer transport protein ExbD